MSGPRRPVMDQRALFADLAVRSAPFIRAVAERFDIAGKHVLSVGAGSCAEEGLLAAAGADVDCVDPLAAHLEIGRELTPSLSPKGKLAFFATRHDGFDAPRRYDLIWASCPQDWMSTSVRDPLPKSYAAFFTRYAADRSVLLVRFWSDRYSADVLRSAWFPKALAERLATITPFHLREVWLSDNGWYALAVATRGYRALPPVAGFETHAARWGQGAACIFQAPEDAAVRPTLAERLTPYILTARYHLRRLRSAVRRRTSRSPHPSTSSG
jgi:hypothetical protein